MNIEAVKKTAHTIAAPIRKQGYKPEGLSQYTDAARRTLPLPLMTNSPPTSIYLGALE